MSLESDLTILGVKDEKVAAEQSFTDQNDDISNHQKISPESIPKVVDFLYSKLTTTTELKEAKKEEGTNSFKFRFDDKMDIFFDRI